MADSVEEMKKQMLYEGKAKTVFATDDPEQVIVYFKDDATAFNGKKKSRIQRKGEINNTLSSLLYRYLEENDVKTHFLEQLSPRDMLVKSVRIIPLEVIVRNVAAGSMAKKLGVEEGRVLVKPIVEYSFKKDELGDPMLSEDHIIALGWASEEQVAAIRQQALRINDLLKTVMEKAGLRLVDFKLEFGTSQGEMLLADEISPDTCRLWDLQTNEKMDKDRFRRDLGKVTEHYQEVLERVMKALDV